MFTFPRRADRAAGVPAQGDRYGTTIRTYDRTRAAWRVTFINPAADEPSAQLIARRDGRPSITPTSFHYSAEKRANDANRWLLYLELFGTRRGA